MLWSAVALWLEHQTLNRENHGSNPLAALASKIGQFHLLHVELTQLKKNTWL